MQSLYIYTNIYTHGYQQWLEMLCYLNLDLDSLATEDADLEKGVDLENGWI